MAVRSVQFVNDDTSVNQANKIQSGVTVVNNVRTPLNAYKVVAGVVLPIVGQNLVQNAVVSTTPPPNPYEGQVWIDIS